MDKRVKELNSVLKENNRKKKSDLRRAIEELGFSIKEIEKNTSIIPNPEVWLKLEFIGKKDD